MHHTVRSSKQCLLPSHAKQKFGTHMIEVMSADTLKDCTNYLSHAELPFFTGNIFTYNLQVNQQKCTKFFLNVFVILHHRKFLHVSVHKGITIREYDSKILHKTQATFIHTVTMFCTVQRYQEVKCRQSLRINKMESWYTVSAQQPIH